VSRTAAAAVIGATPDGGGVTLDSGGATPDSGDVTLGSRRFLARR
jgi:hypothetical protein